ncbi:Uu.00g059830.m01.CDS01 [Anthostomella pinea]|uniref:Uu.00g059830.m01.CDS01 n=1 Tax=Anthostomella pinea TaxID=933095 RepID=A0AAI8YM99_9PEZI|nr:Uu.00g059830.m01.CDS01 [Anthostomella pinea]
MEDLAFMRAAARPTPTLLGLLLGRPGRFLRDPHGRIVIDSRGNLKFSLNDNDTWFMFNVNFRAAEYWPTAISIPASPSAPRISVVFFITAVATACYDRSVITEIGWTILDTRERLHGAQLTSADLSEEESLLETEKCFFSNLSLRSTESSSNPYDFVFGKSELIRRADIATTLENTFDMAAKWGLSRSQIQSGVTREVVMVGGGDHGNHEAVKFSNWYSQGKLLEQWDLKKHYLLQERFGNHARTWADCFRAFGIPTMVNNLSIASNTGNATAFILHLLLALGLMTPGLRTQVQGRQDLAMMPSKLGSGEVLTRVNIPVGGTPVLSKTPYTQPTTPTQSSYQRVTNDKSSMVPRFTMNDVASRVGANGAYDASTNWRDQVRQVRQARKGKWA